MSVSGLDSQEVLDAWKALTDSKTDVNFAVFEMKNSALSFVASGTGGLAEAKTSLADKGVFFIGLYVMAVDERDNVTSTRSKIMLISYIGPKTGVLSKARVSVQKPEVEAALQPYTITAQCDLDDLTAEKLAATLLAAGGAHKPTHYDFGGGEKFAFQWHDNVNA